MKNTKGAIEIGLSATISIFLSVAIALIFISACSPFLTSERTVDAGTDLPSLVARLDATVDTTDYGFQPSAHDLILFFSAGNDSLVLEHIGNREPKTHFKFERPAGNDCKDRSCVCLCSLSASTGYWKSVGEPPFLELNALQSVSSLDQKGFSCPSIQCEATTQENLVFVDGRGVDGDAYYEHIEDLADQRNEENSEEELVPVALDIPIILATGVAGNANVFFQAPRSNAREDTSRYDSQWQNRQWLEGLIKNYRWKGGVAIGASGSAETKRDRENYLLRAPFYNLKFIKFAGYPNMVSVCPYPQCIFEEGQKQGQQNANATKDFIAQQQFLREAGEYMAKELPLCVNAASRSSEKQDCFTTLQYDHLSLLFAVDTTYYAPRIILRKNTFNLENSRLVGPQPEEDSAFNFDLEGEAAQEEPEPEHIVAVMEIIQTDTEVIAFSEEYKLGFSTLLVDDGELKPVERTFITLADDSGPYLSIIPEEGVVSDEYLSLQYRVTSNFTAEYSNIYFEQPDEKEQAEEEARTDDETPEE